MKTFLHNPFARNITKKWGSAMVLIGCLFAAVFLTQCKQQGTSGEWKTFVGKSFLIEYPAKWDVDSTGQFDVQVFTCLSPETGDVNQTLSVGIVMIVDSTDLQSATDKFMSKWSTNTSKSKAIEIGNQPAIYIEANTEGIFFKNYFLKKDHILYYLFFAGHAKAFDLWGKDAEKIALGFRIISD